MRILHKINVALTFWDCYVTQVIILYKLYNHGITYIVLFNMGDLEHSQTKKYSYTYFIKIKQFLLDH